MKCIMRENMAYEIPTILEKYQELYSKEDFYRLCELWDKFSENQLFNIGRIMDERLGKSMSYDVRDFIRLLPDAIIENIRKKDE